MQGKRLVVGSATVIVQVLIGSSAATAGVLYHHLGFDWAYFVCISIAWLGMEALKKLAVMAKDAALLAAQEGK